MQLSGAVKIAVLRGAAIAACTALVGCATYPSAVETYTARFGPVADGAIILFVAGGQNASGVHEIVSGSIFQGPRAKAKQSANVEGALIYEGDRFRLISAPDLLLSDDDQVTVAQFFKLLAQANENTLYAVFGSHSERFRMTVNLEPDTRRIDAIHVSPVTSSSIAVTFHVPITVATNSSRVAAFAALLGHESFHALEQRRAKIQINGERGVQNQGLSEALSEVAADIFGRCIALVVTGTAVQEGIVEINGRRGSVMSDSELKFLLDNESASISSDFRLSLKEALTSTVWSSLFGPTRKIEANTPSGDQLFALCTKNVIGSSKSVSMLIQELANDGVDAPPFN